MINVPTSRDHMYKGNRKTDGATHTFRSSRITLERWRYINICVRLSHVCVNVPKRRNVTSSSSNHEWTFLETEQRRENRLEDLHNNRFQSENFSFINAV